MGGPAVPEKLDAKILPLLPLTTGVVLPGMVVTVTLESSEARAAVEAARAADDSLLLVPREGGRDARVGTVAKIEEVGRTPSGAEGLLIRGLHRATIGSGIGGTGDATWVQVEPTPDPEDEPISERVRELAREYRATVENILDARGVSQIAEFLRGIDEPGALADT